jgi:hypothetical protein
VIEDTLMKSIFLITTDTREYCRKLSLSIEHHFLTMLEMLKIVFTCFVVVVPS